MIRIVIAGAAGRMGQALVRCSQRQENIRLAGAVERMDHPGLGRDSGVIAGIEETGVSLTSDLRAVLAGADVLIDFTFHTAVPDNIKIAADLSRPAVIGTTGLDDRERDAVRRAAAVIPVVLAPNMSLGVNLLFASVRKAASVLEPGYTVEIDETHHVHKKDAPSGTALRLGEKIAEGLGVDFKKVMLHDPEGASGKREKGRIVIRSFRKGEVVGDHSASFENEGEQIQFIHRARSRDAFALGALRAAQWAVGRKPGLYDMQDVLGL